MKWLFVFTTVMFFYTAGCAQNNPGNGKKTASGNLAAKTPGNIGGPCEGCEAIYESPVPFDSLKEMVWLPDWNPDEPRIAINGTVYNPDGTPAKNVIIYIYHTDQTGHYTANANETGWGKRHGSLRGWMKTNEEGFYKFFTKRPAAYPGRTDPAHIHITIKEPGKNEYYIDEFLFDDDPLLTEEKRKSLENRGGSGVLKILPHYVGRDILKSERDIYLGKNIPNYPGSKQMRK